MKKKIIMWTVGIGLLLAAVGLCFVKSLAGKSNLQKESNNQSIKVENVEKVVNSPGRYKGFLAVEGTVISGDKSKDIFLLGCEDSCKFMPVKFKGQIPEVKSKIIVYGEIRKQEDGRYVFQGKEVKAK